MTEQVLFAFCTADGEIGFGPSVPNDAYELGRGQAAQLRRIVSVLARHGYEQGLLLVPGVPEAPDASTRSAAIARFVGNVRRRQQRREDFTPPTGERVYHGIILGLDAKRSVKVLEHGTMRALDPRHDLRRHSPEGFAWGYGGSGPAQLALALTADALADADRALRIYQHFKFRVVAGLDGDLDWTLTVDQVIAAVQQLEDDLRARGDLPALPCQECGGDGMREETLGPCPACKGSGRRSEPR